MILKLDEPRLLSEPISVISELVADVKVKIDKNGINITAMDPAKVSLAILNIPASAFSQFEVEEENLGLNLDDLKNVLRRISSDSSVIMKKEENENMLNIDIIDSKKSSSKRSFSLSLIPVEDEDKKRPDLDFSSEVILDSEKFSEAISDAAVVSDACTFITTKDLFSVEAKGSLHKSRTEFNADNSKLNTKNAGAKYSLEYLQKFVKASKIASNVSIKFSSDYPLRLDFKDKVELSFVLAPRVEEE